MRTAIAVLAGHLLPSCSTSDLIDGRPDWCPGRATMTPITAETCVQLAATCFKSAECTMGFERAPSLRNCPVECPDLESGCRQQCLTQRLPQLATKP